MCDTALILAAKNGYCKEVLSLLEQGFSVEIRDKDNATALYWSCCRGYQEISKILIEFGCDVNARVTWGSTALHASCDRGHIGCVDLLIKSGANVNVQNKRGDTPLHLSSYRGYTEIIKHLLQASANLYIKNEKGKTAAEEAQGNGHQNTVTLLLKEMNRDVWSSSGSQQLNNKQRRVGLVGEQTHFKEMNGSGGVAMETMNGSGGVSMETSQIKPTNVSNDFVRYNTNMSGFCQRTIPQEHTDNIVDNVMSSRTKENKLCRRESINGCDRSQEFRQNDDVAKKVLNSGNDIRRLGQSDTDVRIASPKSQGQGNTVVRTSSCKVHGYNSGTGQYVNGQDYNSSGPYESNFQVRVPNGNFLIPVQQPSRANRSSISCLQEISGNKHEELVAGFAETLQVELLRKQEELDKKENDVKLLTSKLLASHQQVQQLRKICVNLQEEKLNSKCQNQFENTGSKDIFSPDGTDDNRYCISHVGLLSFLKQFTDTSSAIWLHSEHSLVPLKDKIHTHWLKNQKEVPLDIPNREWTPGIDFVLIGDKPINQFSEGQRDGSCSLVFQIKHGSRMLILKMMINLINMEYNHHGDGYSLDTYLTKNFGPEHDIPCKLKGHPNIVAILHHYDGSTERFKKFLSLVIPHKFDVPIEMASRTTFLVMKKYPDTLKTFMVLQRTKYPEPSYGLTSVFVLQLLYQILSAVYHLQRNGIVHRDIKADNILLDENLRPFLADFGLARRLYGNDGKPIKFSNPCDVYAGNSHAWAPELSRLNRSRSRNGMTSLEEIYGKSDAYAVSRMFYSMLRPMSDGDTFPQSSVNRPHYDDSDIPELPASYPAGLRYILQKLVLDNPVDRLSARKAMLSVGMLMFPPSSGEITMETETSTYCQAQMLKLLAVDSKQGFSMRNEESKMQASVRYLMPYLEADFLFNITPEEFWEIYSGLRQRKLL